MKPRTKLQFRVAELSSRLLKITKSQKEWAYRECLPHKGYETKTRVLCLDCGETFSPELVKRKTATCPHCNTKIKVEKSRKTTDRQINYFAITEIFAEFQIVRNYELIAHYKKGMPVNHFLHEILQYWISPDGKVTMFGKKHHNNWCMDSWGGSMEIRVEHKSWYGAKYDVYPRKYHPDSVFKSEYEKYGINHNLQGFTLLEAIEHLPNYPFFETLVKSKYYGFLNLDYRHRITMFWSSLKIVIRNKYKINDASIYLDYLDLLRYFKKDLRNAKFVCPKNLKKEHDKLVQKKRRIQEEEAREQKRLEAIERQKKLENAIKEYSERIKQFLELEFTQGNISISVLKSVDEFKEEGDELQHCVFTNEYYLKQDSLIFSAKVDGKRAETIELKLPTMKIEQARGLKNNSSEHHKQIVLLMKKSIPKIKKIINKQPKRKALKLSA